MCEGNLWISTDGNALGSNDGMFAVPTLGANRGQVLQFLTVPIGAECSGPLISADQLTLFNAVQHPGETEARRSRTPRAPGYTATGSPGRALSRSTAPTTGASGIDARRR